MVAAERKCSIPVLATCVVSAVVFFFVLFNSSGQGGWSPGLNNGGNLGGILPAWMRRTVQNETDLPILAFSITGTRGDAGRIFRLLLAIYHPRNEYVIHLDTSTPPKERDELATLIQSAANGVMPRVGNVYLIPQEKSAPVTYRGVTMLASYLNCAAILLARNEVWDWFINLSASDYPLVTPDDLIQSLVVVPRGANFIQHSSDINWKEFQRSRPIAVDPGLYTAPAAFDDGNDAPKEKPELFFASQRRSIPTNFRLFEGSAWVMLSRPFVEYVTFGFDNLPRLLLLYFANYVSSPEWYFQTVVCNSPFRNTVVNNDLHFIKWSFPAPQHPDSLTEENFDEMVKSRVPFARKFDRDAPVLAKIDRELLGRERADAFIQGAWCAGTEENPCSESGDLDKLKLTKGAKRVAELLTELLQPSNFTRNQCI